jgi:hypothetical protein
MRLASGTAGADHRKGGIGENSDDRFPATASISGFEVNVVATRPPHIMRGSLPS